MLVLDEIDAAIEEAKQFYATSPNPGVDYWNRWPAEQSEAVKERTDRVRQIYKDLGALLLNEQGQRSGQ
jgi:hypothetical protein